MREWSSHKYRRESDRRESYHRESDRNESDRRANDHRESDRRESDRRDIDRSANISYATISGNKMWRITEKVAWQSVIVQIAVATHSLLAFQLYAQLYDFLPKTLGCFRKIWIITKKYQDKIGYVGSSNRIEKSKMVEKNGGKPWTRYITSRFLFNKNERNFRICILYIPI